MDRNSMSAQYSSPYHLMTDNQIMDKEKWKQNISTQSKTEIKAKLFEGCNSHFNFAGICHDNGAHTCPH